MNIYDEIITNKNDELYSLQEKYNVKISRSGSSNTVYVFRTRNGFRIRIGHPISKNQQHIRNFSRTYNATKPSKELVEQLIKENLSKF